MRALSSYYRLIAPILSLRYYKDFFDENLFIVVKTWSFRTWSAIDTRFETFLTIDGFLLKGIFITS